MESLAKVRASRLGGQDAQSSGQEARGGQLRAANVDDELMGEASIECLAAGTSREIEASTWGLVAFGSARRGSRTTMSPLK